MPNPIFRQRIKEYLKSTDTSPLIFSDYDSSNSSFDWKKASLEDAVRQVLELTMWNDSINSNGKCETSYGKFRSSIDIWRHIKFFRPRVSLISVMKAIWKICPTLRGQYCVDVHRVVFKKNSVGGYTDPDMQRLKPTQSEFGILLRDWNKI